MDMEEETRSQHDPQNRYRDRHRQRDERYDRRDDDRYRRNPGYNFGLEGKAKYGSRREPRVKPTGEFLFGLHPVLLALQHEKRAAHKLHVLNRMRDAQDRKCGSPALQEIVRIAEHREIPIEWCSKPELSYMSFQRQHQGVVLHASKLSYSCEPSGEEPCTEASDNKGSIPPRLWLVLSSVQDPMNMGAVLRSAYYLGTEKIVAYNSCHLSPVVSKASAGAMEVFDIHETNDLPKFVSKQKEHGKYVFGSVGKQGGAHPEGDTEDGVTRHTPVTDAVLRKDSLLLVGNEGEGLTEDLVRLCDQLITIPEVEHTSGMNIDCLNVSVATAIMQYHLLSPRKLR